jgi:xanthine dehydrogenase accessory factor
VSTRRIIEAFDVWRAKGEPMVLATVYETMGSTYSKSGHRILIAANGDYQGLVSGGCLEGDLAERAREVAASGTAAAVTYDLRDEVDELWGLGVGCNGLIRVFLQPSDATTDWQPFASIRAHLLDNTPAVVATVITSGHDGLSPGATVIWTPQGMEYSGPGAQVASAQVTEFLLAGCEAAFRDRQAALSSLDQATQILYAPLVPVPRLLLLGAGLDAVPVVAIAVELGWNVTVADHRPGYLQRAGFSSAEQVLEVVPGRLAGQLDLSRFDAALVMSHHLVSDREYLRELADASLAYTGVLGPPARRERLLEELGDAGVRLAGRLKGPVGLDIGADTPESIALSILAEMHAVLRGRVEAQLRVASESAAQGN